MVLPHAISMRTFCSMTWPGRPAAVTLAEVVRRAQYPERHRPWYADLFHEEQGRMDTVPGTQFQPLVDLTGGQDVGTCIVSALLNHVLLHASEGC